MKIFTLIILLLKLFSVFCYIVYNDDDDCTKIVNFFKQYRYDLTNYCCDSSYILCNGNSVISMYVP